MTTVLNMEMSQRKARRFRFVMVALLTDNDGYQPERCPREVSRMRLDAFSKLLEGKSHAQLLKWHVGIRFVPSVQRNYSKFLCVSVIIPQS
jgi:hypothetical protein